MNQPTKQRSKSILMNAAVAVALVYKFSRGAPLAVVLITGLFMFTLVNAVMYIAARKSASRIND